MKYWESILFLFFVILHGGCAFHTTTTTPWQIHRHPISWSFITTTSLFGKGFRGAKNKQATLAQKLEEAKKQNNQNSDNAETTEEPTEPEEEDAHAEFARLLAQNPPKKPPKESSSKAPSSLFNIPAKKPKTNTPTKSAANASRKSKKASQDSKAEKDEDETSIRHVGDKAQRRDFEYLLDPTTDQPLGPVRAAQLVPWVPPFLTDYLVIVADPRPLSQTTDWKLAVQYLHSQQFNDNDTTTTFLAICASDSPKEVLAWKQQRLQDAQDDNDSTGNNPFTILMDSSSLDWMTTYGCVGGNAVTAGTSKNPWSLHILIVDNDGIIRFHEGGVDPSKACPMVRDSISASFPQ